MKAQEVSIKPGTMKIVMQPDAEVLDEVVVTGMTKVDKRLFTGAADRLTAASVKLDGLPDISRGLEGRSAGVSVQNVSGTFGTAPKIRVRGATSIYGNSKPLWVVDGVIMDDVVEVSADQLSSGDAVTLISSAIAGLNADDIESFQGTFHIFRFFFYCSFLLLHFSFIMFFIIFQSHFYAFSFIPFSMLHPSS